MKKIELNLTMIGFSSHRDREQICFSVPRTYLLPKYKTTEHPTTQHGRLTIYPCLQKTTERTSEEPKICVIKIVIKIDSKRSI